MMGLQEEWTAHFADPMWPMQQMEGKSILPSPLPWGA